MPPVTPVTPVTHIGPLDGLPIACTLTPGAGKEQIERWRAFDDEYALEVERTDTQLIVHYTKVDDSVHSLRDLVAIESSCCSFVDWVVDEGQEDLRLVVTGTPEQLAALNVG